MKQILIKITSGEPILTQPHLKFNFLKKFYSSISENYKKQIVILVLKKMFPIKFGFMAFLQPQYL